MLLRVSTDGYFTVIHPFEQMSTNTDTMNLCQTNVSVYMRKTAEIESRVGNDSLDMQGYEML